MVTGAEDMMPPSPVSFVAGNLLPSTFSSAISGIGGVGANCIDTETGRSMTDMNNNDKFVRLDEMISENLGSLVMFLWRRNTENIAVRKKHCCSLMLLLAVIVMRNALMHHIQHTFCQQGGNDTGICRRSMERMKLILFQRCVIASMFFFRRSASLFLPLNRRTSFGTSITRLGAIGQSNPQPPSRFFSRRRGKIETPSSSLINSDESSNRAEIDDVDDIDDDSLPLLQPSTSPSVESGHVYYVATPLGNLKDITVRAIDVLSNVDIICAEDTRHTVKLLRHLNLPRKDLLSHHEHNWQEQLPKIVSMIQSGKSVAVVSDAGTPGISDPGAELAAALTQLNIPLHPVPGPSAVVTALSVSGFSASEFTFLGFLAVKGKERQEKMQKILLTTHPCVIYEAPHRMKTTFQQLVDEGQGLRPVVCCRELTKLYEEFKRGTVAEVLAWLNTFGEHEVSRVSLSLLSL